ncbi:unnamed protein product [Caenorhabditis sp. 36 PRJEB53466]|nr:unnamed protein product [Caenorhabditis sp. 36 PRJEB53466]
MIEGPTRKHQLQKYNISRVLTVATEPIAKDKKIDNVDYKFIHVFDMPSQSILRNGILKEAIKYIDEAVGNDETVVVHCLAAISRSVTICVGYQMLKNNCTVEEALRMVQSVREAAAPNIGFMSQLRIWERCGMDFSEENYENLKCHIPGVYDVSQKTLWRFPVIDDRTKIRFKCRSCRKLIFSADNIMHSIHDSCKKYLIEPMAWLEVKNAACSLSHSCGAKLGHFDAQGSKCTGCAKFVRPWIIIDKSKVDKIKAEEPTAA